MKQTKTSLEEEKTDVLKEINYTYFCLLNNNSKVIYFLFIQFFYFHFFS